MGNRDWDNRRFGSSGSRWDEDRERSRRYESREAPWSERTWRDEVGSSGEMDRGQRDYGRVLTGRADRGDLGSDHDRNFRGELPRDLGYRDDRRLSGVGDEWANRGLDRDGRGESRSMTGWDSDRGGPGRSYGGGDLGDDRHRYGRSFGERDDREERYGRSFGGGDLGGDRDRWGRDEPRGGLMPRLAERGRELGREPRGDFERDRGEPFYRIGRDWNDRDWDRSVGLDRTRGGAGFTDRSYTMHDRGFAMGGEAEHHRGLWSRMKDKMIGRPPRNYQRSDERIREDLYDRLLTSWIDADDVDLQVKAGEVTLNGSVPTREEKRALEDLAEGILGVRDVHNLVRVNRGGTHSAMGETASTQTAPRPDSRTTQPALTQPTGSAPGTLGAHGVTNGDGTTATGVQAGQLNRPPTNRA